MSADPVPLITPPPVRVQVTDLTAYEITLIAPTGVTLRLEETQHDAAVFLDPQQLAQLRADLATAMLGLDPHVPLPGIRSPAGHAVLQHFREGFLALIELDKANAFEVDEIFRAIVAHVRSARPFTLLAVPK